MSLFSGVSCLWNVKETIALDTAITEHNTWVHYTRFSFSYFFDFCVKTVVTVTISNNSAHELIF